MALSANGEHTSQFFITTRDGLNYLDDEPFTVFGKVGEGMDVVQQINEAYCDPQGRPYRNIRIKHVYLLEDPLPDPKGMFVPEKSPEFSVVDERNEADDPENPFEGLTEEQVKERMERESAKARAQFLEMIGDLPHAEVKPPDEVLFVCKLNPDTQEEDLEVIFSKFGKVLDVDIIRDFKTGRSLNYGFVTFQDDEACVRAYKSMEGAIIDDRRIHVDFCQSVSKVWQNRKKGISLDQIEKGVARDNRNKKRDRDDDRRNDRRDDRRKEKKEEEEIVADSSEEGEEKKHKKKKHKKDKKKSKKHKKSKD